MTKNGSTNRLARQLLRAIDNDERIDYALARDAAISPERIYGMRRGGLPSLATADALCRVLGLELRKK